ncbi:MAG: hypothetical protein ISS34_05205 [Candidatus Omnitrophica bacterium]|nr:hypothetical protein [Candidatus Omnitrophota bacterium]
MKGGKKGIATFKIKNRKGYAAVCSNHLTEGRTRQQACYRMTKALQRKKRAI